MKWIPGLGAILLIVLAGGGARSSEPPCGEPPRVGFLQRIPPAGGWFPYGGGLVRWWPQHCFPCGGAPDDYCHKPLPCVCWPPYPSYFTAGAPDCTTSCRPGTCTIR